REGAGQAGLSRLRLRLEGSGRGARAVLLAPEGSGSQGNEASGEALSPLHWARRLRRRTYCDRAQCQKRLGLPRIVYRRHLDREGPVRLAPFQEDEGEVERHLLPGRSAALAAAVAHVEHDTVCPQ